MERASIISLPEPHLIEKSHFKGPGIYRIRRWKSDKEDLLPRYVFIYLPPAYFTDRNRRFPVIYLHDGQHVWEREKRSNGGWKLEKALKSGAEEGRLPDLIAVAAGNTVQRWQEYIGFFTKETPYNNGDREKGRQKSASYQRFIAEELIPWIDSRFRTRPEREFRALMGSSNGASVSLFIASAYPELFSRIGLISGNFLDLEEQWKEFPLQWDFRIWLDCGTEGVDQDFLPGNRGLEKNLRENGYGEDQFHFEVIQGGKHMEPDWAFRLPRILEYLWSGISL